MKNPAYMTNRQISIPYLLKVGEGKILKIGRYLFDKDMTNIALFLGEGIENILGEKLFAGLKEYDIKIVYKQVVSDIEIEEITKTAFNLPSTTNAIIGLGGGKALDFAKYAAYLLRIPYISVPTSTSNDGFCSPNASLTVGGFRKSVKSSIPYGVVIDLEVIKASPDICFYSGVGDMVSKVSALWDWKAAANKGLERYNDFSSILSYNSLDLLFLRHSDNIKSPRFQRSLTTSLLYSGIAMEMAGTSRPASGSEHLISHALDEVSIKPKMHGLQVGTASYLCSLLQDNPMLNSVKDFLQSSGFFAEVEKSPFDKSVFIEALKKAPSIKPNYYTILSEADAFDRALEFIEKDQILQKLIVR